ncbi:O-antigen polymerase [uncultured Desulfuromusa sp.]|uniref:O-antigen polymerase n=1 Tax=uncultured Desulfuromusa sp. TaxID=219183 RepID=UPI002AA64189|nr:O-antigen polymerase [uncultured Desulfuromusa sp.]
MEIVLKITIYLLYLMIFSFFYFFYMKNRFLLNPASLNALFNALSFVGIVFLLDFSYKSDLIHLLALFIGFISYIIGVFLAQKLYPVRVVNVKKWYSEDFNIDTSLEFITKSFLLSVFSIAIIFIYYNLVGYNLFLVGIKGGLGQSVDVAGLRLAMYSGEKYTGAGYVNQFKNFILPLLTIAFFVLANKKKSFFLFLWAFVLFLFNFYSLLGTGQRAPFVIFLLIIYFFSLAHKTYKQGHHKSTWKTSVLYLCIFVFFMSISAVFLGRSEQAGALKNALERIFLVNQYSAVVAFRYINEIPVAWGGQWFESIMGILPGHRGSDFDNIIFSLIWGSTRGNSPPSVYGSIYYNFYWFGLFFIPLIYGFICHCFYRFFLLGPRTLLRVLSAVSIFLTLGMWAYGTPVVLLNRGLLAVLFLLFIYKFRIFIPKRSFGI